MKTEKYRFIQKHLYKYDKDSDAYIHCYHHAGLEYKAQAVFEYENEVNLNYDPLDYFDQHTKR